uniref:Uncharacterized protein n=1 Tax=Candidatus Methanogaster sp. ANME-2c ERB4 TaxID=2759911 RepID=A0A7G9YDW9_9EURY|nr:hypothetical protein ABPEKODN_00016 [Methanosarcinales archaeon ANME-2c ERB4]
MVKKLKQGERYPEGFIQSQILLKLCGKDITPTSEIIDFLKDQFGIREQKNIREHHLKILEKKKLIKRESAGRGHPDYWSVIPDFRVLKELVDRLNHDPDSQHEFMRSQYYRGMTHDLAQQFVDSTPNKDRYMIAPLSEDDALLVTQSIIADGLRDNWLALKFVTHFISVDSDERSGILSRLMETSLNPVISPTAARNAEYKKGFRSGMEASIQYIDKDKELAFREKRMEAEMKTVIDNYINWTTFFAQLLYLNSNYRYLFD